MSLAHTVDGRTQFLISPPKRAKMWAQLSTLYGTAWQRRDCPPPKRRSYV